MLEIRGVAKRFMSRGELITALERIDLDLEKGEFVTIVGPSGCGKSTLLNIVSGLMPTSEGEVRFNGTRITRVDRRIGYITQSDNLFPWRTLRDNVAFPLEIEGASKQDRYVAPTSGSSASA